MLSSEQSLYVSSSSGRRVALRLNRRWETGIRLRPGQPFIGLPLAGAIVDNEMKISEALSRCLFPLKDRFTRQACASDIVVSSTGMPSLYFCNEVNSLISHFSGVSLGQEDVIIVDAFLFFRHIVPVFAKNFIIFCRAYAFPVSIIRYPSAPISGVNLLKRYSSHFPMRYLQIVPAQDSLAAPRSRHSNRCVS